MADTSQAMLVLVELKEFYSQDISELWGRDLGNTEQGRGLRDVFCLIRPIASTHMIDR
jgi:hypothetical protein